MAKKRTRADQLTPMDYFGLGFGVAKDVFDGKARPDTAHTVIRLLLDIVNEEMTLIETDAEAAAALGLSGEPLAAQLPAKLRKGRERERLAAERILEQMQGRDG